MELYLLVINDEWGPMNMTPPPVGVAGPMDILFSNSDRNKDIYSHPFDPRKLVFSCFQSNQFYENNKKERKKKF